MRNGIIAALAALALAVAIAPPARAGDAGTYTHWETVACQDAGFYRNYSSDNFQDLVTTYHAGDRVPVRDEPLRREGPRGVRVYTENRWGYMSKNCF